MSKEKFIEQRDNFYPIFLGCLEEVKTIKDLKKIYEMKTHVKLTSHLYEKQLDNEMENRGYIKTFKFGKEKKIFSDVNKISLLLLNEKVVRKTEIKNFLMKKDCRKYFSIENLLLFFNNDYEAIKRDGKSFILAVLVAYDFIEKIKMFMNFFETVIDKRQVKIIAREAIKGTKFSMQSIKKRLYLTFYITCREMKSTFNSLMFQSLFHKENFEGLIDKMLKDMNYGYTFKEIKEKVNIVSSQPLP